MGHGHHGNLQQIIDQLILFTSDPSVLVVTAMTRRHMESDSGNQLISTHKPTNHILDIGFPPKIYVYLVVAVYLLILQTIRDIVSMDTGPPPDAQEKEFISTPQGNTQEKLSLDSEHRWSLTGVMATILD